MQQLWLVTMPNLRDGPRETLSKVKSAVEGGDLGSIYEFSIPPLSVGTLDSVVALSDDLNKINTQVENVVRKVERQYLEIREGSTENLTVNGTTVENYFKKFKWDFAKYQHQGRQLSEIVSQIQAISAKIDDELKKLSVLFNEKNNSLSTLQRRKVINFATSDLEDFVKPEKYASLQIINSASLLTVFVVVSKSAQREFEESYHTIGSNIAAFNNPNWTENMSNIGRDDGKYGSKINRTSKQGSPVCPDSLKLVLEEGESLLYTITILKGHSTCGSFVDDAFVAGSFVDYLEPLKHAFREKRYTIRESSYDPAKAGGLGNQIKAATEEVKQMRSTISRWCKAHYGEIYVAWSHLKAVKAFVESVLRYGLPVNFLAMFIEPNLKREKQLRSTLTSTIFTLCPQLVVKKLALDAEEEDDDTENLPYVCFKFPVIGAAT